MYVSFWNEHFPVPYYFFIFRNTIYKTKSRRVEITSYLSINVKGNRYMLYFGVNCYRRKLKKIIWKVIISIKYTIHKDL